MDENLDLTEAFQVCYVCDGTGMVLGYNGDPVFCYKCHGYTVIPLNDDEDNA